MGNICKEYLHWELTNSAPPTQKRQPQTDVDLKTCASATLTAYIHWEVLTSAKKAVDSNVGQGNNTIHKTRTVNP